MVTRKIHVAYGIFVIALIVGGALIAELNVKTERATRDVVLLPAPTPALAPGDRSTFAEYRGVAIGMTTDDLRKKLGAPKDKGDIQDFYTFTETESAQFYYDDQHTLTGIMVNFTGNLKAAPTPKDVFGEDVPPKSEGGIFKMVRYPKAGYWISYNRGSGDDAMITIAIQKI